MSEITIIALFTFIEETSFCQWRSQDMIFFGGGGTENQGGGAAAGIVKIRPFIYDGITTRCHS